MGKKPKPWETDFDAGIGSGAQAGDSSPAPRVTIYPGKKKKKMGKSYRDSGIANPPVGSPTRRKKG